MNASVTSGSLATRTSFGSAIASATCDRAELLGQWV
jgi:hypothetical protein